MPKTRLRSTIVNSMMQDMRNGVVEEDIIGFPEDYDFYKCHYVKNGYVYCFTDGCRFFFWPDNMGYEVVRDERGGVLTKVMESMYRTYRSSTLADFRIYRQDVYQYRFASCFVIKVGERFLALDPLYLMDMMDWMRALSICVDMSVYDKETNLITSLVMPYVCRNAAVKQWKDWKKRRLPYVCSMFPRGRLGEGEWNGKPHLIANIGSGYDGANGVKVFIDKQWGWKKRKKMGRPYNELRYKKHYHKKEWKKKILRSKTGWENFY